MIRSLRVSALVGILLLALALCASPVAAAPAITITPASGPTETEFVAELRGFVPGETIALRLSTSGATPRSLTVPAVTIDAAGGYRLSIAGFGLLPGDYTLAALRGAEVVASARFAVTAGSGATPTRAVPPGSPVPTATRPLPTATVAAPTPPPTGSGGNLPGLPNTGAGGARDSGIVGGALTVAAALALGALRPRRGKPRDSAPDTE